MTTDQITTRGTELKAKHRATWASGDYPSVADVIAPTGKRLTQVLGITARDRVIDVAAGSGNASVPAARTGAQVTATDLTPELLDAGRRRNPDLPIIWRTGDAENLPADDDSFDVAMSCVGVMFAPDHQRCADELVRVTRPGGRIGLLNWTPAGFIGRLFGVMKPYLPTPPSNARPGVLWGEEAHVRSLLGDRCHDLVFRTESVTTSDFADGAAFRDFFKTSYGPTISAFAGIADDPARTADLDAAMAELADRELIDGQMAWEYLLVTGIVGPAD